MIDVAMHCAEIYAVTISRDKVQLHAVVDPGGHLVMLVLTVRVY